MGLLLSLWKPHMPEMVCLLVLRDPVRNAVSLARNEKKSSKTGAGRLTACCFYRTSTKILKPLNIVTVPGSPTSTPSRPNKCKCWGPQL